MKGFWRTLIWVVVVGVVAWIGYQLMGHTGQFGRSLNFRRRNQAPSVGESSESTNREIPLAPDTAAVTTRQPGAFEMVGEAVELTPVVQMAPISGAVVGATTTGVGMPSGIRTPRSKVAKGTRRLPVNKRAL